MIKAVSNRLALDRQVPVSAVGVTALLWVAVAVVWYGFLMTHGTGRLTGPVPFGLTFNSMLLHLLQGRFDVDPDTIGAEGYIRDGAVYAYFGIFPALFRVFFLPLRNFARIDFTAVSCLTAVAVMALFKAMTVVTVWRRFGASASPRLFWLILAAILASGAQIEFLVPSIYQESVLWAGGFAAIFVYLLLRGWLSEDGFTPGAVVLLGLVAGLCLLTRVSTGLGLYIVFGLVWLRLVWQTIATRSARRRSRLLWLLASALVPLVFVAVTAIVNFGRWGNPLVFVDLNHSIMAMTRFPDRLARVREYGEFNLARLPYALGYYFLPIWVLRDGGGELLWSSFAQRTIDSVELPPCSFFFSDPLLVGLAAYGLVRLIRDHSIPGRGLVAAGVLGLSIPIALMLTAISMTFRYRLEFYPLLEFLGFVGFTYLIARRPVRSRLVVGVFERVALAGIVTAHLTLVLYAASPFGPAWQTLGRTGVIAFYRSALP